jgi:hypothetical protein
MSESYPNAREAPPALPATANRQRFQFHLRQLLAFMLVSCVLAAGARLVLGLFDQLPVEFMRGWPNVILGGVTLGFLAWFFLRVPFLIVELGRTSRRWQSLREHRRELAQWAKARRDDQGRIMEPTGERET